MHHFLTGDREAWRTGTTVMQQGSVHAQVKPLSLADVSQLEIPAADPGWTRCRPFDHLAKDHNLRVRALQS